MVIVIPGGQDDGGVVAVVGEATSVVKSVYVELVAVVAVVVAQRHVGLRRRQLVNLDAVALKVL